MEELGAGLHHSERAKRSCPDQSLGGDLGAGDDEVVFHKPAAREQILQGLFVVLPFRLPDFSQRVLRPGLFRRIELLQAGFDLFQAGAGLS